MRRFAGGHRDPFDAHVAGDDERQREPDAAPAVGEKSARAVGQVVQADGRPRAETGDQHQAGEDERQDRDDLDQREPVLDLAEHAHLRHVDRDERRSHADDPHPRRHAGKPEGEIDRDGRHFGADRQDLDEGVGGADHEAEPGRQIAVREHPERPRHRVDHGHLGEGVAHHHGDQRAEQIGDDHPRPGQPDRDGAAEEQPHADRAAHRHHGDLTRDQRAGQSFVCRLHWIVMCDGWSARSMRGAYPSRKKPRRTPRSLRRAEVVFAFSAPRSEAHAPTSTRRTSAGLPADTRGCVERPEHKRESTPTLAFQSFFATALPPKAACGAFGSVSLCPSGLSFG